MSNRKSHIEHLSASEIKSYLDASLSENQMHKIERHLLQCDFCNEAIDGYQEMIPSIDITKEIEEINFKIERRSKKKKAGIPYLKIASIAILLLISGYFVTNYLNNKNLQLSEKKPEKKEIKKELLKKEIKEETNKEKDLKEREKTQEKNTNDKIIPIKEKNDSGVTDHFPNSLTKEKSEDVYSEPLSTMKIDETILETKTEINDSESEFATYDFNDSEELTRPKKSKSNNKKYGNLIGKVVDNETGEPIPFAAVVVKDNNIQIAGTATDFDGQFAIDNLDPSKYDVYVSVVGYNEKMIKGVIINSDKITFQDIDVNAGVELNAIDVVAYTVPLIDKDSGSSGGTVTSEDITNIPMGNASSVSSTVAGVDNSLIRNEESRNEYKNANPTIGKTEYEIYLENGLIYPEEAKEKNIEGIVKLRFIVNIDGTLSDFKIIKSLGFGCDEEAIRLIKEGPLWNPAIKAGLPVNQEVKIKINFK